MPVITYDDSKVERLLGGSQIIRLRNKGDSIDFVLASPLPNMVGRHWIDRQPSFCPRINLDRECLHCKKVAEWRRQLKETPDGAVKRELEKKINSLKVKIKFYYRVVVVGGAYSPGGYILEVPSTVYVTFKNYVKKGIKIEEHRWSLERTEESPASYYSLINLGPVGDLDESLRNELVRIRDIDVDAVLGLAASKVAGSGIQETGPSKPRSGEEAELDIDQVVEEIDGQDVSDQESN